MPTFTAPGMDVPPDIRRRFRRRVQVDGLRLRVELLPGLWKQAPFYGILVSTSDHQHASFQIRRPYARCGRREYEALLKKIRVAACAREGCGRRCLLGDPNNPEGLCPKHWRSQLKKDVAREQAEASAGAARDDGRARERGLRYKALIWIHRDGDDVCVVRYFKTKPAPAALRRLAKGRRSRILDDFSVTRI